MDLDLTVVVPTFDRRRLWDRLVAALANQTLSPNRFEVIAVDDGSSDDTTAWLRGQSPPYRSVVLEQSHRGPAAARNLGVSVAKGRIILFLDDDVIPFPDLLERHVAAHTGHAQRVVVGPMMPPTSGKRAAWVRWEEDLLQIQYRDMLGGRYRCTPKQFYTANASVLREFFDRAGGFDARFQRAEDIELAFRLRAIGASFYFEPRACVTHAAERPFAAWLDARYQYGRNDVVMYRESAYPTLPNTAAELAGHHPLTRHAVRLLVGRGRLADAAVTALSLAARAADAVGMRRVGRWGLSAVANVLYWQGVCDEVGGRERLHQVLREATPVPL